MKNSSLYSLRIVLMGIVLGFNVCGKVSAQVTDWNVAGPADWNTSGNWTSGVPDTATASSITNGGTSVIDGFDAFSNSMEVGGSAGSGNLQIINGGALTTNSTIFAPGIGLGNTGAVLVDASTLSWTNTGSTETLRMGNAGGNGTLTIINGGVVNINNSGSGDGNITLGRFGGTATLNIGTGSGAGILNATELQTNGFGASSGTGTVNFNHSDANYFFTRDGTSTGTGILVSESISVNQIGTGKTTLISNNTYTGGTTITAGTLQIGNGGTSGSISGNVLNDAVLAFNRSNNYTFSGDISGAGSLSKLGAGTLTLSGNNSFSGGVTVESGTLRLASNTAAGTGTITTTGSVIDYADGVTISNPININSNTTQLQVLTGSAEQSGVIGETSGPRPLEKIGVGALELSGTNTYTGTTTLSEGTLVIGNNSALGTGNLVIADGTTLATDGNPRRITNNIVVNGDFNVFPDGTLVIVSAFELDGNMNLNGGNRIITNTSDFSNFQFGQVNLGGVISNGGLTLSDNGSAPGDNVVFFRFDGASANTYTGDTVVGENVSLVLDKSDNVTSIAGNVSVGTEAVLVVSRQEQIADTSTVTLNGTGRLQLGISTDVTETLGSLNDDGGGSATVDLSDNSTGSTLRVASGDFSGIISGGLAGGISLEKYGSGILVLSGSNDYLGKTSIIGGTLSIGSGDNLGAGDLILNNGALLVTGATAIDNAIEISGGVGLVSNDHAVTLQGNLTGSGGFIKQGSDILTLAGDNSGFSGTTTIDQGTLSITDSSNLGSGDLIFDDGALLVTGPAVINNNITLNTDRTGLISNDEAVTLNGVISGDGSLIKQGSNALVLTETNTYTGTTTVNGGLLVINGTLLNSDVIVNTATLGGTGTIQGNLTVNNGGFLAPGNSPGLLTVGSLNLMTGSTSLFQIQGLAPGTEYDQIRVNGSASLAGTLQLEFGGGYVPHNGDSFTLIDTDNPITGNFDSIINPLGNAIVYTTSITDDYVFTINAVQTAFANFATTPNQRALTTVLDDEFGAPGLLNLINKLNSLPGSSLPEAFEELSPEELAAMTHSTLANARALQIQLTNRFREIRSGQNFSANGLTLSDPSRQWKESPNSFLADSGQAAVPGFKMLEPSVQDDRNFGVFVSGQGVYGDFDGDNQADGFDFTTGGMTLGMDYRLGTGTAVGLYGGYQGTDSHLAGGSKSKSDSAKFGVYGTHDFGQGSWLTASIGGGVHSYDTERTVLGSTATGNAEGREISTQFGLGHDFKAGQFTFGPEASLAYTHLWIDGFTENGSLAPLKIGDQDADSLRSTLGGRVSYDWIMKSVGMTLRPYANLGWQHEFMDDNQAVSASFANGAGGVFTVNGSSTSRDSLVAGAGVGLLLSEAWALNLGYATEVNSDYEIHQINGSVSWQF